MAGSVLATSLPSFAQPGDASAPTGAKNQAKQPAQKSKTKEAEEDELFRTREVRESQEAEARERQGEVREIDEKPLEEMSLEEAKEAGFIFGDQAEEESRSAAIFLAATAGLLVHGAGHWYVDEPTTALYLLVAEGVSVGLMGSAFLWRWLSDDSPASQVYAGPALYAGLGLFGLSYILDVIGTAQNSQIGIAENTRRARGISVAADYRYLGLEELSAGSLQLLSAGTTVDFGTFYFGGRTDQEISLETSVYGATLGGRPWQGPFTHDYVFAEVDGEWLNFGGIGGFRRLSGQVRAGVSFELGHWVSQLRRVAIGASIGYGRHWYAFPIPSGPELKHAIEVSYIPVETFLHFNLTERLNARLAYEYRQGDFLQTARPGLGMASLEFLYRSTNRLDLVLRGRLSGGFSLSGGLRLWLWE
ncbi:hypothetical protein DN745_11645 [Bradymonas sediminis]|uniref:Uncharacterized protein n=1 Tax=Bradymonas sediminis TaxID=1548548 RepID=A0A2Z4FLS5_9DELT|nr:hypothetical protein DN745_11645 [Bradymonas sediminis]